MVFPLTFSRIGLVVVSDSAGSEMEDQLTEVLTDHILGNATGTKTSPLLSQEDFKEVSRDHTALSSLVHTSPFSLSYSSSWSPLVCPSLLLRLHSSF